MLVISISLLPLIGFSLFGVLMVLFPGTILKLKHFDASMLGSLKNNNLEFRKPAIIITRIFGFLFILCGIGVFLLLNGYLDSIVNINANL